MTEPSPDRPAAGDIATWGVEVSEPILRELESGYLGANRLRSFSGGDPRRAAGLPGGGPLQVAHDAVERAFDLAAALPRGLRLGYLGASRLRAPRLPGMGWAARLPTPREAAHDVVERVYAFVGALAGRAPGLVPHAAFGRNVAPAVADGPRALVAEARPGGTTVVRMAVENTTGERIVGLRFCITDLISRGGGRVSAGAVTFAPASLDVAGHSVSEVTITVAVPSEARFGVYVGLVEAVDRPDLRAVLTVEIT